MAESIDKMPRGKWMATEGRQLYHGWLVDLIDQHRNAPDYLRKSSALVKDARQNLNHLSRDMAASLVRLHKAMPVEENSLFQAKDDLYHYTSIDEFVGAGDLQGGVTSHSRDGVSFASGLTVAMALEASEALGVKSSNTRAFYEAVAEIMRNPTFQGVLEDLSATGFAVLGTHTYDAAMRGDLKKRLPGYLGQSHLKEPLVRVEVVDEAPVFYLNPTIRTLLADNLRKQNKEHEIDGQNQSYAIRARIEEPSFTSGCPVRRAPQGAEKSAIALFSDYLAENVEDVIVKKLCQQQVGVLAVARFN